MTHQPDRPGDRIRTELAALVERSQFPKRPAPGPVTRPALVAADPTWADDPEPVRMRGPQKSPRKEQISIRLDPDVLSALRSGGPGWQSRLNAALREMLELDEPADAPTPDTVIPLHRQRRTTAGG